MKACLFGSRGHCSNAAEQLRKLVIILKFCEFVLWQFAVPVFSLKRTILDCMDCSYVFRVALIIFKSLCLPVNSSPNYGWILWRSIFKNIFSRCDCSVVLKYPVGNSSFCYRLQLVSGFNIKAVNRFKIIFWLWLYILFQRFCLIVLPSCVLKKWIVNRSWEVVFLNLISRRHLQG